VIRSHGEENGRRNGRRSVPTTTAGDSMNFMGMETATGGKRKMYNTTLDSDLIRKIKILAAQLEKRQNDLLEEAIKDLLKKYNLQVG
jgi:hypothetical protein